MGLFKNLSFIIFMTNALTLGCSQSFKANQLESNSISIESISEADFMKGKVLIDDIIVSEDKLNLFEESEDVQTSGYSRMQGINLKTWKNGIIPVELKLINSFHKEKFWEAADKWRKATGIDFVKYNSKTHKKRLKVIDTYSGCYAEYGEPTQSDFSIMNLDFNELDCRLVGVIMHEMAHVVGFMHEHQRFDRDDFVEVNYSNVNTNSYGAFSIIPGIPLSQYDFASISHYDDKSGSINGQTTISVKAPYSKDFPTYKLGEAVLTRAELSQGDIQTVRQMYNVRPKTCLETFPMADRCKWRDVICSAKEGELVHCFSGAKIYKVNLDKEFSNGKCIYGKTYFIDERPQEDRLYVTGGCDGDFGVREAIIDEEERPHSGCGPQSLLTGDQSIVRAPHGKVGDIFKTLSQPNLYDAFNQLHYQNLRFVELKCQNNQKWKIISSGWQDNPYKD